MCLAVGSLSTSFIFVQNEKCRYVTHVNMSIGTTFSTIRFKSVHATIDVFRLKSSEAEKKSSHEKGLVISQNAGLPERLLSSITL